MYKKLSSIIFIVVSLSGCSQKGSRDLPFNEAPEERKEALTVLQNMKPQALRMSFQRLEEVKFFQKVDLNELDASGAVLGAEHKTVVADHGKWQSPKNVERTGVLKSPETHTETENPFTDLAALMMPEDAFFRQSKTLAQYVIRFLDPIQLPIGNIRVLELMADPRARNLPEIRSMRLYIQESTSQLVGLDVKRTQSSWVYQEQTHTSVRLQWAQNRWLPVQADYTVLVKSFWSAPKHYRMTFKYAVPA